MLLCKIFQNNQETNVSAAIDHAIDFRWLLIDHLESLIKPTSTTKETQTSPTSEKEINTTMMWIIPPKMEVNSNQILKQESKQTFSQTPITSKR